MGSVNITKATAAQRQIDAAVRMLFSEEDVLAIHTVTAAAHRIVVDLLRDRNSPAAEDVYASAIRWTFSELSGRVPPDNALPQLMRRFREWRNRPANFLKHADKDAATSIDLDTMDTDHLLLEACVLYSELGLPFTPEMRAFGRWHLGVYPQEEEDRIHTGAGNLSALARHDQLDFGSYLLSIFKHEDSSDQASSDA